MPTVDPRPSDAEVRRALAECMTAADIDDAMGWPSGTARRRRWRAPDRGGLPFADAELGGTALWFRSTFEAWQAGSGDHDLAMSSPAVPDRVRAVLELGGQEAAVDLAAATPVSRAEAASGEVDRRLRFVEPAPAAPPAEQASVEDVGATDAGNVEADGRQRQFAEDLAVDEEPAREPSATQDGGGADVDSVALNVELDPSPRELTGEDTAARDGLIAVQSGFELEVGQHVLAEVQGRWRDVVVTHRDRATVAVDYALDDTPLGLRRQRIAVERVRVLNRGGDSGPGQRR